MKNYFEPVPREWGYVAFIDELKPLIEQAKSFDIHDRQHDSDAFRGWRHHVSRLCTRISRSHVDSDTGLDHRQFRVMSYGSVSQKDKTAAFNRDMQDTLVELQHIVDQYQKYGEPKTKGGHALKAVPVVAPATSPTEPGSVAKTSEPEWPQKEKLTLYWLLKNLPLSAWAVVGALCVGAYSLGTAVGAWPSVQKWLEPSAKVAKP